MCAGIECEHPAHDIDIGKNSALGFLVANSYHACGQVWDMWSASRGCGMEVIYRLLLSHVHFLTYREDGMAEAKPSEVSHRHCAWPGEMCVCAVISRRSKPLSSLTFVFW